MGLWERWLGKREALEAPKMSEEAHRILNSDLVQRYWEEKELSFFLQWAKTPIQAVEEREEIYRLYLAMQEHKRFFENYIAGQ